MIKRLLVSALLAAFALGLMGCGAGKAGSSSEPGGTNPGLPSMVQLLPMTQIAQKNASIYFKAKVLDGNGSGIPNTQVIFTNLSPLGVLSGTAATTDNQGIATVSLFSSEAGFATVQAEVNAGTGKVRDKRTVFFSVFDMTAPPPVGPLPPPALALDVDSNNNGIFNEAADFILLQGANDNQALIRATVASAGIPIVGEGVLFSADSTEATFPTGDTVITNSSGQGSVFMVVNPEILRTVGTTLNVTALGLSSGAFNVATLFLQPVTVNTVTVFANPKIVESGGSSEIIADVVTTAGTPVPDGTAVNFAATGGGVPAFAQTTGGKATASWTAPTVGEGVSVNHTITASVGGKSGSVQVQVNGPVPEPTPPTPTPLTMGPATAAVSGAAPVNTVVFTVSGGTAPYVVTATCTAGVAMCNDTTGTPGCGAADTRIWNTSATLTVTVGDEATGASPAGNCTLTVTDFAGGTDTSALTIL